jgi:WD40 repeat protein/transcriptional regulator with XRE-family HTH domain
MASEEAFKDWLKQRRKALDLTQAALAHQVGCSISTLQHIEEGTARPSRQLAELLAVGLEIPAEERPTFVRLARHRAGRPDAAPPGSGSTAPPAPPDSANPYKGLRAFQEADAPDFFGRESLAQRLRDRLGEETELARFLAVVGPSGAGKSSVVRAGLLPAVRDQALAGGWRPVVVDLIPGAHPLEELEAALLRVARPEGTRPPSLLEQLQADERGLARAVQRILPGDDTSELLLVIDQFEELFTVVPDERVRAGFINSLFSAVADAHSRLRVVITLRADFYDRPLRYLPASELLGRRTEIVAPLAADEMYQAITAPAERHGLKLERGLAAALMQDVGEQPGTLPLLEYALTELYERRAGRRLTLAAYRASGGVFGALTRRAESLYTGLTGAEQAAARQLFLRLVAPGDSADDTRRRVLLAELRSAVGADSGGRNTALERVLDLYGRYRMLTFDRDPRTGEPTVEVAHEALLSSWPRLRGWLDASREHLLVQRRLLASAAEWRAAGQDRSFLARGARLAQFAELAEDGDGVAAGLALTAEEQAYLTASLGEQQRQEATEQERQARELALQKRAAGRLRTLVAGLAVFLLVASGLAAWALNQGRVAEANAQVARTNLAHADALRLAAEANNLLLAHGDSQLIALLGIRAITREYSPQADAAVSGAALLPFPVRQYLGSSGISGIAISPDGRYLVAADDKVIHVWDISTGQVVRVLTGHADVVLRVSFSPDGKYLASASIDRTARVWDFASGQTVHIFSGHTDAVADAVFTPDAKYLATGAWDGTARLWDVATAQTLHIFTGHTAEVGDAVFSPDGKHLLTGSADKTLRLWDVATGQTIHVWAGHTDGVEVVACSPDGRYVASAGADKTVRLWDAASSAQVRVFTGHSGEIQGLQFSPDGKYLLSGGDTTARLWDVASGRLMRVFAGHKNGVYGVAFTPDGRWIATSSFDQTALLWPRQPAPGAVQFAGHDDGVEEANFSPDGTRVVTASDDHTARVWDAATGQELVRLSGHDLKTTSAVFSPDGKTILTASADQTARLWGAATGRQLRQFTDPTDQLRMAGFSPDGQYIASAGAGGIARIWAARTAANLLTMDQHNIGSSWSSVTFSHDGQRIALSNDDKNAYIRDPLTGKDLQILRGHSDYVHDAVFSPDDRYVLTSSVDGTARLWDAQTGKEVRRFIGHSGPVEGIAFSPNGKYVLTGGDDQTARLWDVQTGAELRRFSGHSDMVHSVAFSPDGKYILTASLDKTARIWQTDYHDTVRYLCSVLTRDLTPDERAQYGIADPQPTCPAR